MASGKAGIDIDDLQAIRRRFSAACGISALTRKSRSRSRRWRGVAAMSVSSFHRHFKAVTGLSPLAYHKQMRLREARRRLLTEPGAVASVAFSIGYESVSQFSREYTRQFGAPPARDAARLRAGRSCEPEPP